MNLGDWVRRAASELAALGYDAGKTEARLIVADHLGKDVSWVMAHPDASVPEGAEDRLARRLSGEPLAYILGWREFWGRRFAVDPRVLIPRQDTETLVEVALGLNSVKRVLDVGTGSGALAVTLALERPDWSVEACDLSPGAIEVARANAQRLVARVTFFESDLFSAAKGVYDLIVSNPPYVAAGDQLPAEIRDHEPALALWAEEDGFAIYQRLAREAHAHMAAGARLLIELGAGQEDKVTEIFTGQGFRVLETRNDLAGIPRAMLLDR